MHCEKNLHENMMKTIFGTKVIPTVREDLKECGIQPHLWLQEVVGRMIKPIGSFVLAKEEKDKFICCWQLENTISLCVIIEKENSQGWRNEGCEIT
jgi:hypothetical protein